jgi:segregation and condensation protein B
MEDLKNILESLLFVAQEPLSLERLKKILETVDGRTLRQTLNALAADYDARPGGFHLREVAGGFQLRSRAEYNQWIKRLVQPSAPRLSKAALETLAIVAYKQPIIRSDVEHIRGVDCGGILRMLLERNLVRVLGRKEIPGRPLIYGTTKLFLEVFDLKDLKDLPSPKEIEALNDSALETLHEPEAPGDEDHAETGPEGSFEKTVDDLDTTDTSTSPPAADADPAPTPFEGAEDTPRDRKNT